MMMIYGNMHVGGRGRVCFACFAYYYYYYYYY